MRIVEVPALSVRPVDVAQFQIRVPPVSVHVVAPNDRERVIVMPDDLKRDVATANPPVAKFPPSKVKSDEELFSASVSVYVPAPQ